MVPVHSRVFYGLSMLRLLPSLLAGSAEVLLLCSVLVLSVLGLSPPSLYLFHSML